MTEPSTYKKRVPPTAMLENRVSFAYINGVSLVVSNIAKWDDAMVMRVLDEQSRLVGNISSISNITHFFGDVFGAHHRKMIVQWMEKNNLAPAERAAMVTDSSIMRAALTAYSWLSKTETKAFLPNDRPAMCEWVCKNTDAKPTDILAALETCYKLIGK